MTEITKFAAGRGYVQDNGCKLAVPDGFVEEMYGAVAAIIDEDPTVIHDIDLEAAAFLCARWRRERGQSTTSNRIRLKRTSNPPSR